MVSYGRHWLLDHTLDTLFANTDPDKFRLILIDNGSKQPVRDVIAKYTDKIDDLILFNRNAGKPYAQNIGMSHVYNQCLILKDEIPNHFIVCDSDLEFKPGWLEKMTELYHEFEPQKLGCLSGYNHNKIDSTRVVAGKIHWRPYCPGCCMMFSRQLWEKVGIFDTRMLIRTVDTGYLKRCRVAGYENANVLDTVVDHTGKAYRTFETSGNPIYFDEEKAVA